MTMELPCVVPLIFDIDHIMAFAGARVVKRRRRKGNGQPTQERYAGAYQYLLDLVPSCSWTSTADLYERFTAEFGTMGKRAFYRYLARMRDAKLVMWRQDKPTGNEPTMKYYRRAKVTP